MSKSKYFANVVTNVLVLYYGVHANWIYSFVDFLDDKMIRLLQYEWLIF